MDGRANLAAIGWAVGDPSRASILAALMCGQALTAGELAHEAGIAASTASGHLAALSDRGFVLPVRQGRHRYYALASVEVAELLERLSSFTTAPARQRGTAGPAMRLARTCYDHLAGELGVRVFEAMVADGRLVTAGQSVMLTASGKGFMLEIGVGEVSCPDRFDCRACLDFTERRPHLAGPLARDLLAAMRKRLWLVPGGDRRILSVTPIGLAAFDRHFRLE